MLSPNRHLNCYRVPQNQYHSDYSTSTSPEFPFLDEFGGQHMTEPYRNNPDPHSEESYEWFTPPTADCGDFPPLPENARTIPHVPTNQLYFQGQAGTSRQSQVEANSWSAFPTFQQQFHQHDPPNGQSSTSSTSQSVAPRQQQQHFTLGFVPVGGGTAPEAGFPKKQSKQRGRKKKQKLDEGPVKPLKTKALEPSASASPPLQYQSSPFDHPCQNYYSPGPYSPLFVDFDPIQILETQSMDDPLYEGKKRGRKLQKDDLKDPHLEMKRQYARKYRCHKRTKELKTELKNATIKRYIDAAKEFAVVNKIPQLVAHFDKMEKLQNDIDSYSPQSMA